MRLTVNIGTHAVMMILNLMRYDPLLRRKLDEELSIGRRRTSGAQQFP